MSTAPGSIGRLTHRGVVHAKVIADLAHHDRAGIEPDAKAHLDSALALELRAEAGDRLLDGERPLYRAQRMILEG